MEGAVPLSVLRASSFAELVWSGRSGPQCRGVLALTRGDRPAVAFTYAEADGARAVAASDRVTLALTEPRGTGRAFQPLLLHGTPRLVEDPRGELFVEELLDQELRRFPPSRLLADSPLLRREHWWYLPRLIIELELDAVQPVEARSAERDHLLVTRRGERYDVQPVGVTPSGHGEWLDLRGAEPADGAQDTVVFGQDASFPDLERWSQWSWHGRWDGHRFAVDTAPDRVGLTPVPGLLSRWRRQRALERGCRQGLRAVSP